jgi:1-deoxy-D-xylulose-5-phosphate reductoisomerase
MRSIVVLGSTGSIGTQTLDVVRSRPEGFRVAGLAACRSWESLLGQAREFAPRWVAASDAQAAAELRGRLPVGCELIAGEHALEDLCRRADYDLAVHGVVGARGVLASQAVLERGKALALANKESLVVAGAELMEIARSRRAEILPVDSELCAIFQCLRGEDRSRIARVHVTASGGPFRDKRPWELDDVTPEMALRHPTWSMGKRITVGSATLMNKALEVIEVHHLFGLGREQISVLLHRQSVVHSMVEFVDGSVIAQMGPPDMRGPLHYCLHHPERVPSPLAGFDLELYRRLTFEEVDPELFPSLELGYRCLELGADSGAVLNAADEVAVEAFLEGRLAFPDLHRVVRTVLERRPGLSGSIERLLVADARARELAQAAVAELSTLRSRRSPA